MIDWKRYWAAAQYVMEFPQAYDSSLMDIEDGVKEMTPDQARLRYEDLKQIKDTLEETLETLYIDMQVINMYFDIEQPTPEPQRQQQWKLVGDKWEFVKS